MARAGQTATRRQDLRIVAFVFLTIALFALGSFGGLSPEYALLWTAMVMCIVLPVLANPEFRRDAFHPYSYFSFTALTSFGLPILLVVEHHSTYAPFEPYAKALLLLGVSVALFFVGYRSGLARRLSERLPTLFFGRRHNLANYMPAAVFLYGLGWIARIARGDLGFSHHGNTLTGSQQSVSLLSNLDKMASLGFILLLVFLFSRKRHRLISLLFSAVLLFVEAGSGALVGGRSGIALPFLYAAFALAWTGFRIQFLALVVTFVTVLLLAGPPLTAYQSAWFSTLGRGHKPSISLVFEAARQVPAETKRLGGTSELRAVVMRNSTSLVDSTLRVLDRVPRDHGYSGGGEMFGGLAEIMVPRLLWPTKPTFDPAQRFAADFWDLNPSTNESSIGIGMPAESYLNFGLLGPLILFPILGIGYSILSRKTLERSRSDPTTIVFMVFVLFHAADIGQTVAQYIAEGVRTALVYVLFLTIVHRRLPRLVRSLPAQES